MADRVRAGIIGAGLIGGVHSRAIRGAGGVVGAVIDATQERSLAAAERFGAERAAGSIEELIASDDIDVVHVCVPNTFHEPIARAAIAAGKPVVCEKPLAVSLSQAQGLVELAREAGVKTAVPFVYRFYPSIREARARIASGETGDLRLLHGSYLQDWLVRLTDENWRLDPSVGGASRAFGDLGVHWCDLLEFVTGHRIVRLTAHMTVLVERRGVARSGRTEDAASVLFETDKGASGSLVLSQVSPGRKNRLWFSFDGAEESLSFDQENPETLWIGGLAENRTYTRGTTAGSQAAARYTTLPAGHPQGFLDCFTAFVSDFYDEVRGETRDGLPTFSDGLRAAVITDAVLRSAESRSWVEVPA